MLRDYILPGGLVATALASNALSSVFGFWIAFPLSVWVAITIGIIVSVLLVEADRGRTK